MQNKNIELGKITYRTEWYKSFKKYNYIVINNFLNNEEILYYDTRSPKLHLYNIRFIFLKFLLYIYFEKNNLFFEQRLKL